MSQLKVYPEYKDSGVEWIGKIPSKWDLSKIKYVANINESTISENTDPLTEINYIDIGSVISMGKISNKEKILFKDAPSRARRILKKGDTVISTVRTYLRSIATIDEDTENLIGSTGFAVLTPSRQINSYYLSYLFHTPNYIDEIVSRSVGVSYPAINSSEIGRLECILPNKKVQNQIVLYLKKKITEIDILISDKERLIELLEEKRQAMITEAVTKGLDPNVKMKDSGIEWVGEIPEHWNVVKLKRLIKVMNGKEIENELDFEDSNSIDVYGSGGVFKKTDEYLYDGESVLFGRKGTIGKPIYVDKPFWTVDTMYYTNFYKDASPKWFYYLFSVFPWAIHTTNTALPSLVGTDIENDVAAVPSYEEQIKIVNYLDKKTSRIFDLLEKINNQILKLKEYRESLIYEAVTGKIDVREYATETEEVY